MVIGRKQPMRMCVGCRASRPKAELIRIVRTPEGRAVLDEQGRQSGRGVYLCPSSSCFDRTVKVRGIQRALDMDPGPEVLECIRTRIREREGSAG